jgi:hypothetical protein
MANSAFTLQEGSQRQDRLRNQKLIKQGLSRRNMEI